jgi:NDP-sugar pyrophosphorylase family protein
MNIVMPAAGRGQRFVDAGFKDAKPFIKINGEPMIKVAFDNLGLNERDDNVFMIFNKEHFLKHQKEIAELPKNCKVSVLSEVTQGATCTVLTLKSLIDNDEPLLVMNCDQYVLFDKIAFWKTLEMSGLDGMIMVFDEPSRNSKWSFAKVNSVGLVNEVAEKKPISALATVGVYFFARGSDFVKYAERMIALNRRVNGEFYNCPVYNEMIDDGKKIGVFKVARMQGLGTPEDLKEFEKNKCEVF